MSDEQDFRLLIVIQHLAVDGLSWRILLEDIQTAYNQLCQKQPVTLPAKTTAFKHWAERLVEYAQSESLRLESSYWLAVARRDVSPLPVDYIGGNATVESARTVSVSLTAEQTRALMQEVPSSYQTQINDALLTALARTLSKWAGGGSLLIDLEGHGREAIFDDLDVSRTVGWFTSVFPVLLQTDEGLNPGDALKSVKERLRAIPNNGIGYGLLRYLSRFEEAAQLRSLPQASVLFNYLGQFDQLLPESTPFLIAQESSGPARNPKDVRSHLLEINGFVADGQLQLDWTYSQDVHRRETIEYVASQFLEELRSIIAHCRSAGTGGYTPSDFPRVRISQQELDELVAGLSECGAES
jgi:non-ribosomal peptide synthase protein (TIGR01720 family)